MSDGNQLKWTDPNGLQKSLRALSLEDVLHPRGNVLRGPIGINHGELDIWARYGYDEKNRLIALRLSVAEDADENEPVEVLLRPGYRAKTTLYRTFEDEVGGGKFSYTASIAVDVLISHPLCHDADIAVSLNGGVIRSFKIGLISADKAKYDADVALAA